MKMTIQVVNLKESVAMIDKISAGLVSGMGPALVEIGDLGSKYFGGVAFQSKGSAFGEPWPELAESTRMEKDKHWKGRPDMVRTGEMLNSFTYEVVDATSVRLYNAAPWFVYHQSAEEHHKLPRRVMLGVTDSFKALSVEAVKKQVGVIIDEAKI